MTARPLRRARSAPGVVALLLAIALLAGLASVASGQRADAASGSVGGALPATASSSVAGSAVSALVDAPRPDLTGTGSAWTSGSAPVGAGVTLRFASAVSVSSIQLFGAPAGGRIATGRLDFSDGSSLPTGALLPDAQRPTTLAFPAKRITSVTFTITKAAGTGAAAIAEFGAWATGTTPPASAQAAPPAGGVGLPVAIGADCPAASPGRLAILCPVADTPVLGEVPLTVAAPGATRVALVAWSASAPARTVTATAAVTAGLAAPRLDVSSLPYGPFTVEATATSATGASLGRMRVQLLNAGGVWSRATPAPTTTAAAGMTLAYADEFTGPLSATRAGTDADYLAAKPEYWGATDFGEAIFAQPSDGLDTLSVVGDDYLRLRLVPKPAAMADPLSWNRTHVGGIISSMRVGGSGFSAQYGYFEARMMAPWAKGAWPAFWMLPADTTVAKQDPVVEVDAVELYGHDPSYTCHTTHLYTGGTHPAQNSCVDTYADERTGTGWHVFGARVTPQAIVYTVDGVEVARHQQYPGGDDPLYFMVNLAAGGGWPIDLTENGGSATMYVDYVRVYV